jgi:hypothetical protein
MTKRKADRDAADMRNKIDAAVQMIGRMGGAEFQLRFDDRDVDDGTPVVWSALARWDDVWQAAGGLDPWQAVLRLLESVGDGGTCTHCGKPTAVDDSPPDALISSTESLVCWYRYDPELVTFRRQCEGIAG